MPSAPGCSASAGTRPARDYRLSLLPEAVITRDHGRTGARWLCGLGLDEAAALGYARRFVTDRAALTGALGWYRALPGRPLRPRTPTRATAPAHPRNRSGRTPRQQLAAPSEMADTDPKNRYPRRRWHGL